MKKRIRTAIEITDTHIKLIQSKASGIISACDIRPISRFDDNEVARLLVAMTRSRTISPDALIVSIPRRLMILRQMKVPSQSEAEIKKIVGLQLVSQIPYPLEDVIYEYRTIDKDTEGYTRILVFIVHKEVSERYFKIFNAIGLHIAKLTLSSLGILEWLAYRERKKKLPQAHPVAVVNIDVDHTEICFCHKGNLLFSRSINYGAKDLDTESVLELVHQVKLSLQTYQKDDMGPEVKKILILSSLAQAAVLKDKLEHEMRITTEVVDVLGNIMCQKNIDLSTLKDQAGLSLTVGFGLALSDDRQLINLIPKEVHITKESQKRKRQWLQFVCLFFVAFVLGVSILGFELYEKTGRFNDLEGEVDQIEKEVVKARERVEFVEFFRGEFQNRIFIADLMQELYKITPLEISFRSLTLDEKGQFTIQGYAKTGASVNTLQTGLVRSSVFKDINLLFATKRRIFNMEVTDFKINSFLQGITGSRDD